MTERSLHIILACLTALATGLALLNGANGPQPIILRIVGIVSMPIIWGIVTGLLSKHPLEGLGDERRFFTRSVILAAIILTGAHGLRLADSLDVINADFADRVWGVYLGCVLVFVGNALPKALPRFGSEAASSPSRPAMRRFVGRSFVLAGFGYAVSWIALPLSQADLISTAFVIGAVVLAFLRCSSIWRRLSRAP